MKTSTWVTIISVAVSILIAVAGFIIRQSDQLSRHDVRIEKLEEDYSEVKEMRDDISDIKTILAGMAEAVKNIKKERDGK